MKPSEKVKILLVDDRPENLFSLEAILDETDRDIYKAESGNEALKLAIKHEFALILSDVQMPGMDGFEMLEILRTNPKNKLVPVIFVTAISKEEQYVHKGYSEGAVDYLFKPLTPEIVKAKTEVFVELYKQNRELREQREELVLLNSQKNSFVGMAAHDLRNPLGAVQHYSQFLLEDARDLLPDELYGHLEIIHSMGKFMMNMVNELLDLSKIESGTFTLTKESVNIKELIYSSVKINTILADRKNIQIQAEVEDALPDVMLDYGKINQVLNNLISNAIKYTLPGTIVLLKVRSEGKSIVIEVIDQGMGIPEYELKNLFKPFQTTSVKATGGEKSTGLGLTIVAKMVEAHNGNIRVSSEVGKGSTFTVQLPIVTSIEVVTKANPLAIAARPDKYRFNEILVCEDDPVLRMLMKSVMTIFDINVHFAENGLEGLNTIKQHPTIDLVFTDVNMPVMGGMEFLQEVKKRHPHIEVVILTATLNDEIIERGKASGSEHCIEKPISRATLRNFLKDDQERRA